MGKYTSYNKKNYILSHRICVHFGLTLWEVLFKLITCWNTDIDNKNRVQQSVCQLTTCVHVYQIFTCSMFGVSVFISFHLSSDDSDNYLFFSFLKPVIHLCLTFLHCKFMRIRSFILVLVPFFYIFVFIVTNIQPLKSLTKSLPSIST